MKLVGIMPVRNEAWCIGLSARAALMWCDELLVLDHASTDDTPAILQGIRDEVGERIHKWTEHDPAWNEMDHRQKLLCHAREHGATHVAMIDADEVLSGNLLPTIRLLVEHVPEGRILQLPWLCLRDSISDVMTSGLWGCATVSVAFRDNPAFHWAARDGYHFHHRNPMGLPFVAHQQSGRDVGMLHLQFASRRRLLAKQALYQAIEVIRWPGRVPVYAVREMYARTVREAEGTRIQPVRIEPTPTAWWQPYWHLLPHHLDVDAEPWQEAELQRLVAEHGREKFAGLDFFGVI